ncbi:MAG: hypothetical protein KDC10_12370 [Calditrichaeota bacterium]|nr:hypothetical protein [Candidatus Cloacimonadota bacterium]MCA9787129.1 hypothetical protein [Candidatus Cloacimonadota bacterium]MCB1047985.1 hypothetical protein [Calditrichota bacterium]MCB9473307.1 hypothetical protein [Candidatus Delongbacteria bacterium]
MARKFGTVTAAIAEALRHHYRKDDGIEIFNDPKQKRKRMERIPRVYSAPRFDEESVLVGLDIAVVKGKQVLALARIFEGVQTEISEVLGVLNAIMLSDKLRVDGRSFVLQDTRVVVAIATSGRGVGQGVYPRLEKRLQAQLDALQKQDQAKGIGSLSLAVATAAGIENLILESPARQD